jgi:hypothetical protein
MFAERPPSDPSSLYLPTLPVQNRPSKSSLEKANVVEWIWSWSSRKPKTNKRHVAKIKWTLYTSCVYRDANKPPTAKLVVMSDEQLEPVATRCDSKNSQPNLVLATTVLAEKVIPH